MQEIEQLRAQRESVHKSLVSNRDEIAFHIKEDHRGWPATTCHECGRLKQRIQFYEEDLIEIDRLLNIMVK